jgi:hypothetical protein
VVWTGWLRSLATARPTCGHVEVQIFVLQSSYSMTVLLSKSKPYAKGMEILHSYQEHIVAEINELLPSLSISSQACVFPFQMIARSRLYVSLAASGDHSLGKIQGTSASARLGLTSPAEECLVPLG